MIIDILKRWREKRDAKYRNEMIEIINNSTDNKLIELNKEFFNGIDFDRRSGRKIRKVTLEIDDLINQEMHNRGLTSCDDIEEEVWFSQHKYRGM